MSSDSGCDPVVSHRLLNTLASVKGLSIMLTEKADLLPPDVVRELTTDLCECVRDGQVDARHVTGPGREPFLNRMAALFGAAETLVERSHVPPDDQRALVDIVSRQADEAAAALMICMRTSVNLEEAEEIAAGGR
jgi:hypothetical protein